MPEIVLSGGFGSDPSGKDVQTYGGTRKELGFMIPNENAYGDEAVNAFAEVGGAGHVISQTVEAPTVMTFSAAAE